MTVAPVGALVVHVDSGRVAIVGHPVRLQLQQDVDDDSAREEPVEPRRVELVDEVVEPDWPSALQSRQQVDDAQRREGIVGLGKDGRSERRVREARRRRTEAERPGRRRTR